MTARGRTQFAPTDSTGFILFNTIFALLYLVGKMAGKTISTRCKYLSLEKEGLHASRRCGDGYCQRECSSVNLFCRILHKYSYVVAINFILLWTMYADFVLKDKLTPPLYYFGKVFQLALLLYI